MTRRKTIFSFDLRVLMCDKCGAAIDGTIVGGTAVCRFCNTTNHVVKRAERHAAAPPGPRMSEAGRLDLLRGQDGRAAQVPPELEQLLTQGGLSQARLPEALKLWLSYRAQVKGGGSFAAQERLYFLTRLCHTRFKWSGESKRMRALLEAAMDVLDDSRHHQILRSMMARDAARLGDFEAAEKWLAAIDPHSDDLLVDTAYRLTNAYIATRQADWNRVLAQLGTTVTDLPFADEADGLVVVFRANAHERLGDLDTAQAQLWQFGSGLSGGLHLMRDIIKGNPELQLCPKSAPWLLAALRAPIAARARGESWGQVVAVGVCVVAGLIFALYDTPLVLPVEMGLATFFGLLVAVLLWWEARRRRRASARWRRVRCPATATLMGVGWSATLPWLPKAQLHLLVELPGHAPWRAQLVVGLPAATAALGDPRTSIGKHFRVWVDPQQPTCMALSA